MGQLRPGYHWRQLQRYRLCVSSSLVLMGPWSVEQKLKLNYDSNPKPTLPMTSNLILIMFFKHTVNVHILRSNFAFFCWMDFKEICYQGRGNVVNYRPGWRKLLFDLNYHLHYSKTPRLATWHSPWGWLWGASGAINTFCLLQKAISLSLGHSIHDVKWCRDEIVQQLKKHHHSSGNTCSEDCSLDPDLKPIVNMWDNLQPNSWRRDLCLQWVEQL